MARGEALFPTGDHLLFPLNGAGARTNQGRAQNIPSLRKLPVVARD